MEIPVVVFPLELFEIEAHILFPDAMVAVQPLMDPYPYVLRITRRVYIFCKMVELAAANETGVILAACLRLIVLERINADLAIVS